MLIFRSHPKVQSHVFLPCCSQQLRFPMRVPHTSHSCTITVSSAAPQGVFMINVENGVGQSDTMLKERMKWTKGQLRYVACLSFMRDAFIANVIFSLEKFGGCVAGTYRRPLAISSSRFSRFANESHQLRRKQWYSCYANYDFIRLLLSGSYRRLCSGKSFLSRLTALGD